MQKKSVISHVDVDMAVTIHLSYNLMSMRFSALFQRALTAHGGKDTIACCSISVLFCACTHDSKVKGSSANAPQSRMTVD